MAQCPAISISFYVSLCCRHHHHQWYCCAAMRLLHCVMALIDLPSKKSTSWREKTTIKSPPSRLVQLHVVFLLFPHLTITMNELHRYTVNDSYYLSPLTSSEADINDIYVHLSGGDAIARNALYIPYPYTIEDAVKFVNSTVLSWETMNRPQVFGIRKLSDHRLIGCIGLIYPQEYKHSAEFGYWIAEPYW